MLILLNNIIYSDSELQRRCFLIKAELQEGRGSAGPDFSLWKRCSSLGCVLGMMSSSKDVRCDAWDMSYLPVTVHWSSVSVGGQATMAPEVWQSWGCHSYRGWQGRNWAAPGRSAVRQKQSQAGLLQRSVLPTQSHPIGIQQGQCHCRQQGQKKKKKGTIMLNYFCYFYSLKAGFWDLCTEYFRLAGNKKYKCSKHLCTSWIGNFALLCCSCLLIASI